MRVQTLINGNSVRKLWVGSFLPIVATLVAGLGKLAPWNDTTVVSVNVAVFVAYWIRFMLGNSNYLEATYSSINNSTPTALKRALFDCGLILLHIAAFLAMGTWICECRRFTAALIFLNLTDLFWLIYEPRIYSLRYRIWWARRKHPHGSFTIPAEWFQPYAPYMWMRSNVLAATMLTIGLFWAPASCALVGAFTIVVGTINTILDLVRTRLRVHGK
jgi:hypothetical protein